MYLLLEVISPNAAALGESRRKVVRHKGARIGRAPDCDWILADPHVSKEHARVTFVNGLFFVEALGRNPVAINDAAQAVALLEPRMLRSGDRLFIDQYEIRVSIAQGEPPEEGVKSEPRFASSPDAPAAVNEVATPAFEAEGIVDAQALKAEADPLVLLGIAPDAPVQAPAQVNWQQAPVLSSHYRLPAEAAGGAAIPRDWDHTDVESPRKAAPRAPAEPRPADTPVRHAVSASLTELLQGAGLPPQQISSEVLRDLGQALRVVVQGVMDVLHARTDIKTQFRLPITRVQSSLNNPLKLSPNVEAALYTLLVEKNSAYLPTSKSFEDAFRDIRHHQMALLGGVREAFDHMLATFDPERLEKELDSGARRGVLRMGGKSRFKEQYAVRFAALMSDRDGSFRRLFGDCFGEAYEKQLEQLKAAGGQRDDE
jgi:type VI secretion system FHA domain protein